MTFTQGRYLYACLSTDVWGIASVFLWFLGSSLFWVAVTFASMAFLGALIRMTEIVRGR